MPGEDKKRVVVTGMGLITPLGDSLEGYWKRILAGEAGFSKLTRIECSAYRTRIAAQIDDFDPHDFIDKKDVRRMDRNSQLAIAATAKAIESSALVIDESNRFDIGVILGSAVAGMVSHDIECRKLFVEGYRQLNPLTVPIVMYNAGANSICMHFGITGVSYALATACASGSNAIGEAYLRIKHGITDIMIAGGSDAPLSPLCYAGFDKLRAMSTRNDDPNHACRPFSKDRDGLVMGEGAGMLVMEELERAKQRGAHIFGEIIGYGTSSDAHHLTYPYGKVQELAIKMSLDDADIKPDRIDYINAHGTATYANDKVETETIKNIFGERAKEIPMSSTKSMIGHALGASGAIELITSLLAIRDGVVPPTINYTEPDPECDLDYVPNEARSAEVKTILSNSFGFGGANAVLLARDYN